MNRRTRMALAITVGLAVAIGAGIAIGRWTATTPRSAAPDAAATPAAPKVLYWYDPMVPEQHFDRPGLSPMGMEMVPRYADVAPTAGVRVSGAARQALGVRTVTVRIGELPAGLRVPGTLTWNLREERVVTLPVQGIVTRLSVRAPFEPVRAGMPLATVLAPEWSTAAAEAAALSRARTPQGWLVMGFDEDLNKATDEALNGALDMLTETLGVERPEALALASLIVDLRVTQIVNQVRGVHALVRELLPPR